MRSTWIPAAFCGAVLLTLLAEPRGAQQTTPRQTTAVTSAGDWPMYRHDQAGTGSSPLTQINTGNVGTLAQVWTYGLQSDAPAAGGRGGGGPNSEATPIVVNGLMYVPAANRIVALEPETGKEVWRYSVTGGAPSRRGVSYWPGDSGTPPRILFVAGRRLIALNAKTGAIDPGFGSQGEVDMV